ncbi:hypothetical protein Hanom_Chr07g00680981 [Helianthus anomalus]
MKMGYGDGRIVREREFWVRVQSCKVKMNRLLVRGVDLLRCLESVQIWVFDFWVSVEVFGECADLGF